MKNLVYDINKLKYSIIVNLGGDVSNWSKSYINSKEELGMFYNMFLEECVMDMGIVLDGSFNFNSNYYDSIKDFNVDVDSYIYEGEDNKSIRISLIF